MITGAVFGFVNTVLMGLYRLVPDALAPPGWVDGSVHALTGLFGNVASMGVWIPLDFAFLCGQALMTTYIGGGAVKAARILISHFTGGGGSAA